MLESVTRKKMAEGNTAEIYRLGNGRILKLFREGISCDDVEREYRSTCFASALLPQVPKAYELTEADGRMGIIFQEVSGTEMLRLMMEHPLRLLRYSRDFAAYHAGIAKPVSAKMRPVREKLRDEIRWQTYLNENEKIQVMDMLPRLPDGDRLCHFDFHPGNVMIDGRDVFYLDWMTACRGDACADAARTWLLLKYGEPMHADRKTLRRARSIMTAGSYLYLKTYRRLTGVKKKQITQWIVPVAAARLNEWLTEHERERLLVLIRQALRKTERR